MTSDALARFDKMFELRRMYKTYLAVVAGKVESDAGVINHRLKSEEIQGKVGCYSRTTIDPAGKEAITKYKVLQRRDNISLLEFHPETGRTHQIRVHCASGLKHPILGDDKYGTKDNDIPLCFHARQIEFLEGSKIICATARLPKHMASIVEKMGYVIGNQPSPV